MQRTMQVTLFVGMALGASAAVLRSHPKEHKAIVAAKADHLMHLMAASRQDPEVPIADMVAHVCKTECTEHCPGFPNCPGMEVASPSPGPGPSPAGAPAAPAPKRYLGVGDPEAYAHLLPFHPDGQPEFMFKSRCINFLNQVLEKAAYEPELVMKLLPKCHWKEAECTELHDDLRGRMAMAPAGAPGPAGSPAALMAVKNSMHQASPAPAPEAIPASAMIMGEHLYGWCDKMYDMSKSKAYHEVSKEQDSGKVLP
eukprot:gnl/TRDRNA2_/TRDRNA2_38430_c0_seq1.p1 gnl/TRDRNA2_/TRDRNA2_38430_c0~~gnl/TRDRNA2_/TRDRNA2_38430_c0_seq1.p1  ORF type:complete len:255 (+),score=55.96 gnl/TRDRNA2_/TRDRNA2_38430_c0_seq1:22-786(+)